MDQNPIILHSLLFRNKELINSVLTNVAQFKRLAIKTQRNLNILIRLIEGEAACETEENVQHAENSFSNVEEFYRNLAKKNLTLQNFVQQQNYGEEVEKASENVEPGLVDCEELEKVSENLEAEKGERKKQRRNLRRTFPLKTQNQKKFCLDSSKNAENDGKRRSVRFPLIHAEQLCPQSLEIHLPCRSVRFGSFRTLPCNEGLKFNETGICLAVKRDPDDPLFSSSQNVLPGDLPQNRFVMSWRHVSRFEYLLHQHISVVFLSVNEYAAKKIRESFKLTKDNEGNDDRLPYFDPASTLPYHKFITAILCNKDSDWVQKAKEFIDKASEEFKITIEVVELSFSEGNKQLADSVPPSVKSVFKRRSSENAI